MELAVIFILLAVLAALLIVLWRVHKEDVRIRQECAAAKARADEMEARLQAETQRADSTEREIRQARDAASQTREEAVAAKTRADNIASQMQEEKQRAAQAEAARDSARAAEAQAREKNAALEAQNQKLPDQFKLLAQNILKEKGDAFNENARKEIGVLVNPLADQLKEFRNRAEQIHTDRAQESAALLQNIVNLQKEANRVAEDANNLTRALKGDKKILGDWGETTLERILEESGLQRGTEYEAQAQTTGADGKTQRPDFKILLPEGRHLIVDSKASLAAYHAYVSAQTDAERERARSDHVIAVRNHARALSEKHYPRGRGVNSPDFVLMFMPIEAAWMVALLSAERLFDDSYSRKVILVARTTLMPTLKTVAELWKLERQNKNAREMGELAGRMHDKFAALAGEMHKIGAELQSAQKAHGDAMVKLQGQGNLLSQARRLQEMGANTKKDLPRLTAGEEE